MNGKHDRFCGGCGIAMSFAAAKPMSFAAAKPMSLAAAKPNKEESTMPIELLRDIIADAGA